MAEKINAEQLLEALGPERAKAIEHYSLARFRDVIMSVLGDPEDINPADEGDAEQLLEVLGPERAKALEGYFRVQVLARIGKETVSTDDMYVKSKKKVGRPIGSKNSKKKATKVTKKVSKKVVKKREVVKGKNHRQWLIRHLAKDKFADGMRGHVDGVLKAAEKFGFKTMQRHEVMNVWPDVWKK